MKERNIIILISVIDIILSITLFMQVDKYEGLSKTIVSRETEIKELGKSIDNLEKVVNDFITNQPQ